MMKNKSIYHNKNLGKFPNEYNMMGLTYQKTSELRYGTNPHQKAAYYRLSQPDILTSNFKILKSAKDALSKSNLEDIYYGLRILKYFQKPTMVIMKHANPSSMAVLDKEDQLTSDEHFHRVYQANPQASFGGTLLFNRKIDVALAKKIMQHTFDVLVAVDYQKDAFEILLDYKQYKKNRYMNIIQIENLYRLPKYLEDGPIYEFKFFEDQSFAISEIFLTKIKATTDFITAYCKHCHIKSEFIPNEQQYKDLLSAWYLNISVRSNSMVLVKNGQSLGIGTGQQDRIGALKIAIQHAKENYKGNENLKDAVLVSDGFLPFTDFAELLVEEGITAVLEPGGSIKDCEVIQILNKYKIPLLFTEERAFSHH